MNRAFVAAMAILCCAAAWNEASADARPDDHAPIGVMADHTHKQGEFMFSYRYMAMDMQGNLDGDDSLSPEEIVSSAPNAFAGMPMMPPTLRVVPTEMRMQMHMLGMMYAPSSRLTLMAMTQYLDKEMDHVTFMGGMGTQRLGTFTTRTHGLGDTRLAALIGLNESHQHSWHATLGLSLPTGSTDEQDRILTPMNSRPEVRLPYPMQLGSGSYDLITGLTYRGHEGLWGWGGQWQATWRTQENDEDYQLGDEHKLSAWLSYQVQDRLSMSARLAYLDRANIDGQDPRIMAPVQTADPDRQARQQLDLGLGANWIMPDGHRLALEVSAPLLQDVDGPQMETDWTVTLGWQFAP